MLSLSSVTTAEVMLREEKKCLSLEASVYHQEMGEGGQLKNTHLMRMNVYIKEEEGQC